MPTLDKVIRPSEKLKKWLHRYVSLQVLSREDLQNIYWEIQDIESELEDLKGKRKNANTR